MADIGSYTQCDYSFWHVKEWYLCLNKCSNTLCKVIVNQLKESDSKMASGPTPKRPRLMYATNVHSISRDAAVEISKRAMSHSLPWSSVVPSDIRDWLEAFALAHNTRPEFIFMGALVSTAAIMGPKAKVRVSSRYEEPTNIYAICLAEPDAGKSQVFKLVMTEPIHALKEPSGSMRVENYTQLGLFKHLKDHDGKALIAQEEMSAFFDLVQRRQLEGSSERQLYCSLYDGESWIKSTGKCMMNQ